MGSTYGSGQGGKTYKFLAGPLQRQDQVLASIASLGHPDQPAAAQTTVLSEEDRAQARKLLEQLVLPLERALRDFASNAPPSSSSSKAL